MTLRLLNSIIFLLVFGQGALATTINVAGTASGDFGADLGRSIPGTGTDLVQGVLLNSGDEVRITATGQVTDGTSRLFGPDGETVLLAVNGTTLNAYMPLEEQLVDDGTLTLPRPAGTTTDNTIGLLGAFLDQATVEAAGFLASDSDTGGSVLSSDLFHVGSLLDFTAPADGYLFFGVNDWFGINNAGSFTVTIREIVDNGVPVPVPLALLTIGAVVFRLHRDRQKRNHSCCISEETRNPAEAGLPERKDSANE